MTDDDVDPVSDSAAPTQCSGATRSWPSAADRMAISTGVAASMSELFATLVSARPPMKKYW